MFGFDSANKLSDKHHRSTKLLKTGLDVTPTRPYRETISTWPPTGKDQTPKQLNIQKLNLQNSDTKFK
jgi:hypothetical protein